MDMTREAMPLKFEWPRTGGRLMICGPSRGLLVEVAEADEVAARRGVRN